MSFIPFQVRVSVGADEDVVMHRDAEIAEMPPDAIDRRVALNSAEATREEFHDSRAGIHCGKRFPILVRHRRRQMRPPDNVTKALIAT